MERLTDKYRDKFKIERLEILNNYAKQTSNKGRMHFVYSQNSKNSNIYNLCLCEEGSSNTVIKIEKQNLPRETDINSVLRIINEEYILDKDATEEINKKTEEVIIRLIQEQNRELEMQRKEKHLYEIVEKYDEKVWLMDRTENTGECFQEMYFPIQLLNEAKEGSLYQYINGEYKYYLSDL